MTGFLNPYHSNFHHCDHTVSISTWEVTYPHPLPQKQSHSSFVRSACLKCTSNMLVQCVQQLNPSEVNLYMRWSIRVRRRSGTWLWTCSRTALVSRWHSKWCVPLRSVFNSLVTAVKYWSSENAEDLKKEREWHEEAFPLWPHCLMANLTFHNPNVQEAVSIRQL